MPDTPSPDSVLSKVLEILPVGVWILDAKGRITHGNPAGQRIWAGARYVGPEEFGQYKGWWADTGEPIAAEEWAAARAIRKGETSIEEVIDIECFDGTRKTILNSALPMRDTKGAIVGAILVNQDISDRRRAEQERERLIRKLQDAVAEVRTLSGLLPICAWCKRIRDEKDDWHTVERYVARHTAAKFTHAICPDCATRLDPPPA